MTRRIIKKRQHPEVSSSRSRSSKSSPSSSSSSTRNQKRRRRRNHRTANQRREKREHNQSRRHRRWALNEYYFGRRGDPGYASVSESSYDSSSPSLSSVSRSNSRMQPQPQPYYPEPPMIEEVPPVYVSPYSHSPQNFTSDISSNMASIHLDDLR